MTPSSLETMAEDRVTWRASCRDGIQSYAECYAEQAEERRRRRQ